MLYNLEIGSSYNIQLNVQSILGTGFDKATVMGLLDYSSAILIEDVSGLHASILALLPVGTPSDPSLLIYAKIKTSTGVVRAIALNWIAVQPILLNASTLTVVISNVNQSQIPDLASCLQANGFNSFTIN